VVKITELNVTGLNQVPETGFVELTASDEAFIPRKISLYLSLDEAKQFYIGQSVFVTIEQDIHTGSETFTQVPSK